MLVNFRVYSCFNCANTRPALVALDRRYRDEEIGEFHADDARFAEADQRIRALLDEQHVRRLLLVPLAATSLAQDVARARHPPGGPLPVERAALPHRRSVREPDRRSARDVGT